MEEEFWVKRRKIKEWRVRGLETSERLKGVLTRAILVKRVTADGWTDGQMDRRMDRVSYRVAF